MAPKTVLLTTAIALTAIALTAPAAVQASGYWWYDHRESFYPMAGTEKPVTPETSLYLTASEVEYGPCVGQLTGLLWSETMGEGEVTGVNQNGEDCLTSYEDECKVATSISKGFPWQITLEEKKKVKITGVEIETILTKACNDLYGLPLMSTAVGNVEGQFVDYVPLTEEEVETEKDLKPATIEFTEATGLVIGGLVPATLDGRVTFGTEITADFIP